MRNTTTTTAKEGRDPELKRMLEVRRGELEREVLSKIRDARNDSTKQREVLDEGGTSEIDIQTAIDFALLQVKVETLNAIDEAVRRIGEGTYGTCVECDDQIHDARLRALPFAVRCKGCEELREMTAHRNRIPGSGHPFEQSQPSRA